MANGFPRSHVNRNSTTAPVRADLTDIARPKHPGTHRDSLFNSGVNANNLDGSSSLSLSLPQIYRHLSLNLPAFVPTTASPALDMEQCGLRHSTQFKSDNVYSSGAPFLQRIYPGQIFSQWHDFEEPSSSTSSSNASPLGMAPYNPESELPSFTRTISSSRRDLSEAGGCPERLTSKRSHDSLPRVYRNRQTAHVPPATGFFKDLQALPPGSSNNSVLSPPIDTGAGLNQYVNSNSISKSKNFPPVADARSRSHHRKDLDVNEVHSSSQSMIGSRLIRPLPRPRREELVENEQGHSRQLKTARPGSSQDHSNFRSQLLSQSSSSSMQKSPVVGTTPSAQNDASESGSASGDFELYEDNVSQGGDRNKGKGKELDSTESVSLKRKMYGYPQETRKGTVGGPRTPSACDACKSSKVRCVFPDRTTRPGESSNPLMTHSSSYSLYNDFSSSQFRCERCLQSGIECHVSGRKKRDPPPSQDELEQKNDYLSEQLLELLLERISLSNDVALRNTKPSTPSPKHRLEISSIPMSSAMLPSVPTFKPQISSLPRYPGSTNAYPPSDQSLKVSNHIRPLVHSAPIRLTDLPPLPVLDKAASRAERESKVEKWITGATERLVKQGYAHSISTVPSRREGDDSSYSQRESETQAQYEGEYESAWNERTVNLNFEEAQDVVENGDYVLDSKQILPATRAYVFGERTSISFEDIPQERQPPILSKKIITAEDVIKLFDIFYDKINMFFSVCDPAIHTPSRVIRSSTFLFTTICAVASRHYTEKPKLYPILLEYAKEAAGKAVNGPKTVETTQAYLILGVYLPPSQTFKADRSYLFFGLAIRNATDIELYRSQYTYEPSPGMPEDQARRLLNRGRTWLNCFCNDRSVSTQMGKATAILIHGPAIPFNLKTWWRCSKWNLPSDIHMCAYADLLSVMADFHDVVYLDAYTADGRKKPLNLDLVRDYAEKVSAVTQTWTDIIAFHFPNRTDVKLAWRDNLWPFIGYYAKLVVLSIGLRDGVRQGLTDKNPFSEQSVAAACALLAQVLDKLAKLGYMRYCVEAYFVFMGFAAAFLLKILRRKFSFMRKPGLEEKIIYLVQRLIDLLGSDEVAIDSRHTPKLYSRFLADILAQHKQTRTNQRPEANPIDHKLPSNAHEVADGEMTIRDNPSTTQPMEDVQMYMYSQNAIQSLEYPDPRLNTAPNGYDASPAMDLDIPLPHSYTNNQDTLLSMMPLRDPTFWDHLGMPLVTNPDTWPQMVDMTYGTSAGLYNPLQAHVSYQDNQADYQTYMPGTHSSTEPYYQPYYR